MEAAFHSRNIAAIFRFRPNQEVPDDSVQEEPFDITGLDHTSRAAAADYNNNQFNVSHAASADKFPDYYKNASPRRKNRKIDLLIVVNLFLTGFDATTLNPMGG